MSSSVLRFFLIFLCVVLTGGIVVQSGRSYVPTVPSLPNDAGMTAFFGGQAEILQRVDVTMLKEKPLFSQSRRPESTSLISAAKLGLQKAAAHPKKASTPIFKLIGVVGVEADRVAVFSIDGQDVKRKRIGQNLAQWSIQDIRPDQVVLLREGQKKVFRLLEQKGVKGEILATPVSD